MQDTSTDTEDPAIEGDTEVEEIGTEEPHSSGAMPTAEIAIQTEVELQNRATQTYDRDFPSQKKASRSRGTCTLGLKSGSDFGQQTALLTTTIGTSYEPLPIDLDEDSDHSEDQSGDESDDDPDWHFSCEDATTDQDDGDTDDDNTVKKELYADASPLEDQKFLVYGSCLLKLLAICSVCFATCRVQLKRVIGSMVVFEQLCAHGHSKVWDSQPCYGTMPAGNLQIASAILFGGNSSVKILNLFRYMNIPAISLRTYSLLQTSYLIPAVENVWKRKQQHHLAALKDRPAKLGGDGRCCSPGHTAKYGSYTLMDLTNSKVLDTQLIQSNEVSSSNAMELEGLKRGLQKLKDEGVTIASITTDRHGSVKKYMREKEPSIEHWFDVWHVAKGIRKKIDAKGKRKILNILLMWSKSISHHVYWVASTSQGDGPLVVKKWLSLLNHVINVHTGHGQLFQSCVHGPLEQNDERDWLIKGSKPYKELELIVKSKLLLKDIARLSPAEQTSSLESFHKVILFFAPKSVHFPFTTMAARVQLAGLHFNENSARTQAMTQTGKHMWGVSFLKARRGEPVIKAVKVTPTFAYVQELMGEVVELRNTYPTYKKAEALRSNREIPPPIASAF
ncbi:uncharacterized protein LOC117550588 [Gymnodraco acuticeps]|uniref:Uncharacterized protein LOC117550588 n=1 Tax=Gymnodraco acuticeps TaxID=8218 RepID=A0A6P8UQH9_GYMAC|nr:uncharacterized protein LOC117550588 [Gymnodraco acuticeps]